MVECLSFSDFQKIFYLTCVVALQSYQDVEIDYSEILTAKDARKTLEGEISVRAIRVNFDESAGDEPEHPKAQAMTECNELDQNGSSIGDWVDEQVGRAKKNQRDGEELNPLFLPKFVNILSQRVKEFPLWTSVGMDCSTHATSSYVEDTEQNRSESTSESQREFNDLLERSTDFNDLLERSSELKTEVNKENMSFDESIFKTFENKRKVLNNIFAKLIEPNGEKKTQFNPSTSNKLDNLIKSPEQPVILKKYEHTENKSCPVKMSPNNIEDQSCDLDLFINKNWQENIEMNELDCLNLDFNIDDVSNFIEMPSNDVESYLDSDLLAIENWRGKVNVNNNFDYDDFNKESVNDH
ncbi:kda protein in nof-fb transposable element-like protein, partial [Lasius niger]